MASGNTTKIDEVVDPVAIEQFNQLKLAGKELRTELSALLQSAINLNAALGGSTPASFAKNLQASTDATNKIIANNNKQIENEQAKAAKQEQILNKYLVMLSKQEAARKEAEAKQQQRDAKEIAAAEDKAAKLAAIQEKADKRAEVMFAEPKRSPNPVTMEGGINLTDAEKNRAFASSSTGMAVPLAHDTAAIEAENTAIEKQTEYLATLSIEQRKNLELLLELKVERAENTAELKVLNSEGAISGERAVFLTQRQIELGISIRQTTLALKQQATQMLAEDTSAAEMQARLDELRVAIQNLSKADLENIEIGGVWIAEAERLDIAIKKLRDSTGDHTKHVGDYARAQLAANGVTVETQGYINSLNQKLKEQKEAYALLSEEQLLNAEIGGKLNSQILATQAELSKYKVKTEEASLATVIAEKVSARFVSQLIRMAAHFLLITLAFGAITAIYDWIKGFDIFTGRLNEATQKIKIFNEALASSDYTKAVSNVAELTENIKLAKDGFLSKTEVLNEYNKVLGSTLGYTDDLNKAELNIIKHGNDYIQVSLLKAAAQLALSAAGKASYEAAQLAAQPPTPFGGKSNQGSFVDGKAPDAVKKYYADLNKSQDQRQKANIASIQKGADLQLKIFKDYQDKAAKLAKKAGIDFFDGTADDKTPKVKKPKDYGNTDLLEANRIEIEEDKKRNKAIFLDDSYSHEARLVALGQYIKKSKELLDNSAEIIKADTNMRAQQRLNGLKKLKNEELDIENERIVETERLNKEEIEKHKNKLAELVTADKEREQESLQVLNQGAIIAAQKLNDNKDKLINAKTLEYSKGKITEKEYNRDILAINDEYNVQRIAQELAVQKTILALKEGARDADLLTAKGIGATPAELAKIASDANKGIDATKNKIADLTNQLGNAQTKRTVDHTKGGKGEDKDKKKELQDALGYAKDVTGDIQDLIDKGYENQISKLEKIGQKIQENADIEKAAIDRSLDTQSNKARREEVLAAETASKQKEIQQQIAKEKHKQAVADKAAAIAEIILNTAIAASKVIGQTGIFGLALEPLVIALGALQLAKVAATPIPQFAKGTPTGGHKGGLAVIGEVGPERVTEPGKPAYYSPGVATMVSLPRGTVVEPYKMLPETPKWTSTRSDNAGVIDAIDRLARKEAPLQGRQRVQGWLSEQRQADAWNGYTSNRFK